MTRWWRPSKGWSRSKPPRGAPACVSSAAPDVARVESEPRGDLQLGALERRELATHPGDAANGAAALTHEHVDGVEHLAKDLGRAGGVAARSPLETAVHEVAEAL